MTNYNDGKWHGWNGGECPVHKKSEVELWDATTKQNIAIPAECVHWTFSGAFRVIKEYKEPREVWIGIDANGNRHIFSEKPYEFVTGWQEGRNLTKYREVLE